jgi:hypothetical protein
VKDSSVLWRHTTTGYVADLIAFFSAVEILDYYLNYNSPGMLDTPSSLNMDVGILKAFHASPSYAYDSYLRLQTVELIKILLSSEV